MASYRISGKLFRFSLLAAFSVLFLLAHSATADHKVATWTGGGDGVSYSDSANWDIGEVPVNGTHTYEVVIGSSVAVTFDVGSADEVTDLSLGGGSTLTINSGKSLTVLDDADIYGYITTDNGAFTAITAAARFPGNAARLNVSGGGTIGIGATTYSSAGLKSSSYTLMSAQGAGTTLDLSSLATINAAFNDGWSGTRVHTIRADTGGVIDMSSVTEIIGPYRGDDRLDLIVGTTGGINLGALLTTSGSGTKLFDINVASYSLPSLQTAGNTKFDVMDAGQLDLAALATFTGGNVTMGDNATVNATALTSFNNSSLTFGAGATFNAPNLTDVSSSAIDIAPGRTLTMGNLINIDNARLSVSGGETFGTAYGDVSATSYSSTGLAGGSYTLMSANGAGSVLDLSSLTSINAKFNDGWSGTRVHTIIASAGGLVDLSNVASITAPYRGDDRLDITISGGGNVDLDGLQSISGSGQTRFSINDADYSLPALQTAGNTKFNVAASLTLDLPVLTSHDRGGYDLAAGATVNAGSLAALTNAAVTMDTGATFNATNLVDFSSSTVSLQPGMNFNTAALSNIDNARLSVAGGLNYNNVSATAYSSTGLAGGSYTLFSANGAGSVLDLSSLQSINAGFNDGWSGTRVHTISASAGGLIDLGSVTSITAPYRGEDRLDITISGGGDVNLDALQGISGSGQTRFSINDSNYSLPALQTVSSAKFNIAASLTLDLPVLTSHNRNGYDISAGATVNATSLAALTNASVTIDTGGTFNAPNLVDFSGSTIALGAGQNFVTGALDNIDNARLSVSGGVNYSNVSATAYSSTGLAGGSYTLFSANGAGSVLDLSSLTSINAGFNDGWSGTRVHTISASAGGLIDLSSVTSIAGPYRGDDRLDVIINGGEIDLRSLESVSGSPNGQTKFTVSAGGKLTFGDMTFTDDFQLVVSDGTSGLEILENLQLDPTSSLNITGGAKAQIGGNFSFKYTDETRFNGDTAIFQLAGGSNQWLEVGGEDLGVDGCTSGNFGIGQLIVGSDTQTSIVLLADAFDNGNRSSREALYLFGFGGPDGLRILNGSTLVIGDIPVYALLDGEMTDLYDLFGPGITQVEFDEGHIVIPEPATLSLLGAGASLMLLRRRRRI